MAQCEGSGRAVQPDSITTFTIRLDGKRRSADVGRCSECCHAVDCSSEGVARVHDRSDVLSLFDVMS